MIPTLIEMAPQITSAIKSVKKGDASSVFLDGVDPSNHVDRIKTRKVIERKRKNLIREGDAITVVVRWIHSSRMYGIISSHGMVTMQRS